jgi:hypothetical protein
MDDYARMREAAGPDDGDMRERARRALQDAYDWRDDDQRLPGAAAPGSAQEPRAQRPAARLHVSTSRTVGV